MAYSDASDTGYGGYIVELGPQVAAQGVWSADLAKESSTMREILAVRKVLQPFAPKLAGLCVKWYTDNQNVARIIGVGSGISGLQSEAKRIFEVCVQHGISIEPEWLPRSSNEQADYLSRIVDFDDWFVSPHIFRFLDLKWGLILSIVLRTSITICYLDLIPGFGILTVKLWTHLPGRGTSTTTGFVRLLTLFLGP